MSDHPTWTPEDHASACKDAEWAYRAADPLGAIVSAICSAVIAERARCMALVDWHLGEPGDLLIDIAEGTRIFVHKNADGTVRALTRLLELEGI